MGTFFKIFITVILFSNMVMGYSQIGIGDPSLTYVAFLGYKYEIRKNMGGEYGVCIFPDNSECDSWAFFRGTCGKKYSYCALKGCDTKTKIEDKKGYTLQYTICSCKDSSGIINEIPLFDFMEQYGDTISGFQKNNNTKIKNLNKN